ncbi:MAG: transposase [Thermoguttaceae bacterium]
MLNRGNERRTIFEDEGDYAAFLRLFGQTQEAAPMRLLAYCLLPNRWHLVLWPEKDGALGLFMQRLTTTHVRRWRLHRHSVGYGHLYQGTYKSFSVQEDEHFYALCRYVDRNDSLSPVPLTPNTCHLDRARVVFFEVRQFIEVGRKSDAGHEPGGAGRVGLEVLAQQGDARPGDEGHRRISPSRPEQQGFQFGAQRAVGVRVEKLKEHVTSPYWGAPGDLSSPRVLPSPKPNSIVVVAGGQNSASCRVAAGSRPYDPISIGYFLRDSRVSGLLLV